MKDAEVKLFNLVKNQFFKLSFRLTNYEGNYKENRNSIKIFYYSRHRTFSCDSLHFDDRIVMMYVISIFQAVGLGLVSEQLRTWKIGLEVKLRPELEQKQLSCEGGDQLPVLPQKVKAERIHGILKDDIVRIAFF